VWTGARAARLAIVGVAVYIGALVAADAVARREVRAAAEVAGLTVQDVMVAPLPGNPFGSEVEVLTPDAVVPGSHRWSASPRVALRPVQAVRRLTAPDLTPSRAAAIVSAARARATVRDYLVWSRYPYVSVEADGDGWLVRFRDARYDGRAGAGSLAGVSVHVPEPEVP
jgi:hypothetical protein